MGGVEINGKPFPLSYELQNGDVVSILTGGGKPSTDWMRYAKTRSTRSKLQREPYSECDTIQRSSDIQPGPGYSTRPCFSQAPCVHFWTVSGH